MKKRDAKGDERKRLDEASDHLRIYKSLLEGFPNNIKPLKIGSDMSKAWASGVFYYNNLRDRFDRLHLLDSSIRE